MSTKARGSAEYINGILITAIKRVKVLIDVAAQTMAQDGHPPLTTKVTLRDLLAMKEEDAKKYLRSELVRTMVKDPETGEPNFQPETVKLVLDYQDAQSKKVNNGR